MSSEEVVHIVDDHADVRDSIAAMLRSSGHRSVCHADADAFLRACPPDTPGCLILDIRMPGLSGLDLQARLNALGYTMPVIFITGHGEVAMAARAFKAGALDFIQKPFRPAELLAAVERGLAISARLREQRRADEALRARLAVLTERERQVLQHVARGDYNKTIAAELGVSISTVEAHRKRITEKLRTGSLYDLVHAAEFDAGYE